MIIELTQDDIDFGIKGSYTECPIALALKRHYNTVRVENFEVTIDGTVLLMGDNLQIFTVDFDGGKSVNPFDIHVGDPCQFLMPSNMGMVSR